MVSKLIRDIVVSLLFVGVFFGTSTFASSKKYSNKISRSHSGAQRSDSRKALRRVSSHGNSRVNPEANKEVQQNLIDVLRKSISDGKLQDIELFLRFIQNRGLPHDDDTIPEILKDVCGPSIAEADKRELLTRAIRNDSVRGSVVRTCLEGIEEALDDAESNIFKALVKIFLSLSLDHQDKVIRRCENSDKLRTFLLEITAPRIAALGDM